MQNQTPSPHPKIGDYRSVLLRSDETLGYFLWWEASVADGRSFAVPLALHRVNRQERSCLNLTEQGEAGGAAVHLSSET